MNQTNLGGNNNKFYFVQLLVDKNNKNNYYCYMRWGRVGVKGQDMCVGPTTFEKALKEYDGKIKAKSVKGDYRVLEMSYEKEEPEEEKVDMKSQAGSSKLPKSVADFVCLIFDMKLMNQQMESMGYDTKKLPLGKLSISNIDKGYTILNDISKAIEKKQSNTVIQNLCNDFYSYIPHDFGF
mmetsp:Transcript_29717/g.27195  ORF Transcript_29717/g.27195 Transcript_29717/m.27195 type:complete len:181 (+) Transcript_29717:472-1014(+)